MYFVALLIVCSLNLPFLGDPDSGATCLKFADRPEIHYLSLADCSTRLRAILDEIEADTEQLSLLLPGPWKYSGKCVIPVIEEASA